MDILGFLGHLQSQVIMFHHCEFFDSQALSGVSHKFIGGQVAVLIQLHCDEVSGDTPEVAGVIE